MDWSNKQQARLTVQQDGTSDTFSFEGVNADNSAGTPEDFLAAANHLLTIAGQSAVIDNITRSIKQEGVYNG